MNSFLRTVVYATSLLYSTANFTAASSSQEQGVSLLREAPSHDFMRTPLCNLPTHGTVSHSNNENGDVIIRKNISGSRGTQVLHFPLSERDYFTTCPFYDHIASDKGFTVLALFNYTLSNGSLGHDIAYAPAFRHYLRSLTARGSQPIHPTHRLALIGTPEYYLITILEGANYRGTFLGTEQETRESSPKASLLELFLKDEKSLDDIINIGNCYQEQRNYHAARTWFERAASILRVYKEPCGQVLSRITATFLAEERWQDVIFQAHIAFMSVRQHERDAHREITGHLTTAYMRLINRHITQQQYDNAVELCHQALTDIKKEEHASRSVILHRLGSMYEALQKAPLSFYCYKQALEENPEGAALSLFHILLLFKNNFDVFNSAEYVQNLHQYAGALLALTAEDRQQLLQSLTTLNLDADYDNVYEFVERLIQLACKKQNEVVPSDEESNCIIS